MTTLPTNTRILYPQPPAGQRRPFLTPLPELPGEFLLVLDNTSLEKVKRCHKAARNYLVLGREGQTRNAALVFGGAIHEGLEKFHHRQWQMQAFGNNEEGVWGIGVEDEVVATYFLNNPLPPTITSSDYRTLPTALEVLKHYRQKCDVRFSPDYEMEILADADGPIIERAFELPLAVLEFDNLWVPVGGMSDEYRQLLSEVRGNDIFGQFKVSKIHLAWSGRIDLLARIAGRPHVLDHKTSSIDTKDYFSGFELSSQVRGYIWAACQLWPEHSPRSFCHNGIFLKKPGINQGLLTPGTRGGKPPLYFQRTFYPTNSAQAYSDESISRWERDTILLIEDFLHSLSRSVFPMNDASCVQKFGVCEYHDCCIMDSETMADRYLASEAYKSVTWNPTA